MVCAHSARRVPFGGDDECTLAGPPVLPFDTANPSRIATVASPGTNIHEQLAKLPRPRKYYMRFYTTREANNNMLHCPQGLHAFLRAYYHYKSADWKKNQPFPLASLSADEWAKLPTYYVMDLEKGMAETVAEEMPSNAAITACKWLTEEDLTVHSSEYGRTGFQGGLQGYRVRQADSRYNNELRMYSGRTIDVPSLFIGGKNDWGVYQTPGAAAAMQNRVSQQCEKFLYEQSRKFLMSMATLDSDPRTGTDIAKPKRTSSLTA